VEALKAWIKKSSSKVFSCSIMAVEEDVSLNPRNGIEGKFYRACFPSWVNVVCFTEDEKIVLVRQYRHGVERFEIELPGGCVEKGELPVEAGVRELLEETGFSGKNVRLLGELTPNPAIQDNRCYVVAVDSAIKVSQVEFDPGEDIEFILASKAEVLNWVREGRISNAMVVAALFLDGRIQS
jgi:ADP-ribose pyrophosphatase